jgi:hypothetical protein
MVVVLPWRPRASPERGRSVPRTQKQVKALRRREMAVRAALCRAVAIRRGRRWCCPLIDVLADYGAAGPSLPYPCQETLAQRLGVDVRTIRRWTVELEALGVLVVLRSYPVRGEGGRYRQRQSHRYLLADAKAARSGPSCPLPRRRVKSLSPPTGHGCPPTPTESSTSGGPAPSAGGPTSSTLNKRADSDRPATPTHHPIELAGPQGPDQDERERVAELLAAMRSKVGPARRRR